MWIGSRNWALRTSLSSSSSSNLCRRGITGSAGEEDSSEPDPDPELVSSLSSSSTVVVRSRG